MRKDIQSLPNPNQNPKTSSVLSAGHADHDHWSSQIPQILQKKNLICINQTVESAKVLHDMYGFFANGRKLSHEVEQHLFDAFIEDDYDGTLHLTTIHDVDPCESGRSILPTHTCDGTMQDKDAIATKGQDEISTFASTTTTGPPLGLVFWREVPEQEMHDWIDWKFLGKYITTMASSEGTLAPDGTVTQTLAQTREMDKSLHLVRQNSVKSIQKMVNAEESSTRIQSRNTHNSAHQRDTTDLLLHDIDGSNKNLNSSLTSPDEIQYKITHAWIKIELVAVREAFWGRRLGSILIASALYHAYTHHHQSRVILHVAGGEDNVPAVRLYRRFGFMPVKGGTLFRKPNRDLYVLGDIARSLSSLSWDKTLKHDLNSDGEGAKKAQGAIHAKTIKSRP